MPVKGENWQTNEYGDIILNINTAEVTDICIEILI